MFNEITFEVINGMSLGSIQYVDDYEDEQGAWFVVIAEFLIFRVIVYWLKKE